MKGGDKLFEKVGEMLQNAKDMFTSKDQEFTNDVALVDFVTSEFEKRQKERLPLELQWRLNIDFVNGNQFNVINTHTKTIDQKELMYWWEVRRVYNQIAPIVETRLAKLSRIPQALKVRPATSDSEDISSAKISTKLLDSIAREQNMDKKQLRANLWGEICGTAIFKPTWNKGAGEQISQINQINEDQMSSQTIFEGDIDTMVCSPFEIYPESIYKEAEENKSIIHAKVYHKKDIKMMWGINVEGEKINTFTLKNTYSSGGMGQKGYGSSVGTSVVKDSVIVYEYWELPTDKYPNGRLIICTNQNKLYTGDLPYKLDPYKPKLPFIPQKCIEVNNCYFGKAIVERLIDLQTQYNALKNRKTEYLNRCAIGQLSYEEGSMDEDMLESDGLAPGQLLPRRAGSQPPVYVQYPALPSTFETEEEKILRDFNRISGVSEVSRDSSLPTGVNSGIALSILQEQDDNRLSLTGKHLQNARIELGKMWLMLYKEFVEIPRILRNVGKSNQIEVLEWDSNSITSFDVYIESSSHLAETPAQRRQMVFDLLQTGLFNDPETGVITKEGRIKIFELLEFGNWEMFDDDENLHMEKANRENRMMIQGMMPQPRSFDDDLMHINKHNNYRLTTDYEDMLQENPQIDQIFEMHLQGHFMSLQNKAIAQAPPEENQNQEGGNEVEKQPI